MEHTQTVIPLIPIAAQESDFEGVREESEAPGVGYAVERIGVGIWIGNGCHISIFSSS